MEQQTRQDFIRAAVTFLQNPKLVDNPLKDKLKFLRDKGLSELEVDEALNLALISRHQKQSGKWNYLLVLGLCLGGYKVYQAYLDSRQAQLDKQNRADTEPAPQSEPPPQAPQVSLSDILRTMGELKQLMERQKTEVQSLKALMLSHHQFAAPPAIPEWQLKKTSDPSEPLDHTASERRTQESSAN